MDYQVPTCPPGASRESRNRIQNEAFIESYRARVVSLEVPFKVTAVFVNRVVGAGFTPARLGYRNSRIALIQIREIMVGPGRNPEARIPMDRVYKRHRLGKLQGN